MLADSGVVVFVVVVVWAVQFHCWRGQCLKGAPAQGTAGVGEWEEDAITGKVKDKDGR